MNLHSIIKMTGELSIKKFNLDNELLDETKVPNLIVTTGKQHIAGRIANGDAEDIMSHMAVGSNASSSALTNTTLGYETARAPLVSMTVSGVNITYTATFTYGIGTGSITEAAIFNAGSAGTMLCRTVFPVITKAANEAIAISWTITVG